MKSWQYFVSTASNRVEQGTGLFLGSGQAIATAGPAGALLAYIVMGFVTAGVAYTTGEITAFMPGTGGFIRHATKFVEPALGAATGWNFCEFPCHVLIVLCHYTNDFLFLMLTRGVRVYHGHYCACRDQCRCYRDSILE